MPTLKGFSDLKKTKLLLIFALTTLVVGVFFMSNVAFATTIAATPWNVVSTINFNGKKYHYNLWENCQNLDETSLQNRGVYLGCKGKRNLIDTLVRGGFSFRESTYYVLVGVDGLVEQMQADNKQRRDAVAQFFPQKATKFIYQSGCDGVALDVDGLLRALLSGNPYFDAPVVLDKAVTIHQLKAATVLRSSFYTTFAQGNANRRRNLQVCASKLTGKVVLPGEKFSFNQVVGERTVANGFYPAKVILDGAYVDGVGDGVCQVATTLYNAVLLADLQVATLYQHSLVSTYVPPSFDAMVSYPNADFAFVNSTTSPLYLHSYVQSNKLYVEIYGLPCDYQISRESVVLERTSPQVEYRQATDQDNLLQGQQKVLTNGSDYVKSQGFLLYHKDGKLVKRVKIRQNEYKMSSKVVLMGN